MLVERGTGTPLRAAEPQGLGSEVGGGGSSAAQRPRVLWDQPSRAARTPTAGAAPCRLSRDKLAFQKSRLALIVAPAGAQLGGRRSLVLPASWLRNNKNPPIAGLRGWRLLFSRAAGATCPVQEARKLPPTFPSSLPLSLLTLSLPLSLSPFPTLSFSLSYACAHTYTHTLTHAWTHQRSSHTPGKMACTRRKSALALQNQRISSLDRLAYRESFSAWRGHLSWGQIRDTSCWRDVSFGVGTELQEGSILPGLFAKQAQLG